MASYFLNHNGKTHASDKLLISANNRSFRYGDGCFETMKLVNDSIVLRDLHFERLFSSLETLQFSTPAFFTVDALEKQIKDLAKRNNHKKISRVRLMVFRGDGGLYDEDTKPNYIIQTWQMNDVTNTLNDNGLITAIYPDARKTCDKFSPIKNNNYLCYAMASLWAKQQKLNDAFLLNPYNRIADATIANIFIIKDGILKTPALTEGCISGVMRRHLLESCRAEGIPIEETEITQDGLAAASEVFLTNAGYGMRWVKSCGDNNYTLGRAADLYARFIKPLHS
jgi:branched-subunit amino acid aminotransferase/4-amino-4-deoxychorismate lyase